MADEYIRLDATIIGIDGLINEAPTGSQARALLCAKDLIYDQQRYYSEMQPVKRGRWELTNNPSFKKCSECGAWWGRDIIDNIFTNYCPKCGAYMRETTKW